MRVHVLLSLLIGGVTAPAAAVPPHPGTFSIRPGDGIGHVRLGPDGAAELQRLPPPTATDAGMSQERLVWVSKKKDGLHHTLFVHLVQNGVLGARPTNGLTVDEIRVTSPAFHTPGGLRPGSPRALILRHDPHLARLRDGLFVDSRRGIGYEFSGPRCVAIEVFPPGQPRMTDGSDVEALLRDAK